jgi:tetratricopeptide (TPR) repeat protein
MPGRTIEDIRRCFSTSTDFNEIFEAFEAALALPVKDIEPYRLLFWNHSLTPDEVRLFGEKLAAEFPELAYEVFLWLASIFEATESSSDNYELAFHYYQKAARVRPAESDPYLDACDCYEPDLNIPPRQAVIDFVRLGILYVPHPSLLYKRLARLYELSGEFERAEECRRVAEKLDTPQRGDSRPA